MAYCDGIQRRCYPGTEECYYIVAMGLCQGPRGGCRTQDKTRVVCYGHTEKNKNGKFQRFVVELDREKLYDPRPTAPHPDFPVLYDQVFDNYDQSLDPDLKCHLS